MQERRQGSVGRIGHPLSAAALLLHTCLCQLGRRKALLSSTLPVNTFQAFGRIILLLSDSRDVLTQQWKPARTNS